MPKNIESAEPEAKARFREALGRGGEGAEVTLEIDGGPPSERYHYRVTLAADGVGEHEFVSDLKKIDRKPQRFEIGREAAARIFRLAAADAVVRARPVRHDIPPDSLIATVTVRAAGFEKRVLVPVDVESEAARAVPTKKALAVVEGDAIQLATEEAADDVAEVISALAALRAHGGR